MLLYLACWMAVSSACRKDEVASPPEVEIIGPASGSTLAMPDTLRVTVRVDDDGLVERVAATVVDEHGVPVAPGTFVVPPALPATVTLDVPLTSDLVDGGPCRIWVSASDGTSTTNAYRPVQIIPVPRRLRSVFAFAADGTTATIHRIDSTGVLAAAGTFPMHLSGAATVHRAGTLLISGGSTGDLIALDANTGSVRWSRPNMSQVGEDYFQALQDDGHERALVATSDGFLRGFHALTGIGTLTGPMEGRRVDLIATNGDQVACAVRTIPGNQPWVRIHHAWSGVVLREHPSDLEPVALHLASATEYVVLGNRAGQGIMQMRDVDTGAGWEPRTWSSTLTAAVPLGGTTWLVALADGGLERLDLVDGTSLPLGTGPVITDLAFDPVSGTVFAVSGEQVLQVHPGNGTVVGTWHTGAPLRHVRVLLNR